MSDRAGIFWACTGLLVGVGWIVLDGLFRPAGLGTGVGAAFLLLSAAELLPKEKTQLAGWMRLGAMLLGGVLLLLVAVAVW